MKSKEFTVPVSIFIRKGGEGLYTKLINENTSNTYKDYLAYLERDEKGLIICFMNLDNWTLLTTKRVISCVEGKTQSILNSQIVNVAPALENEYMERVYDKRNFTRLKITTLNGRSYLCKFERGLPYEGFYQMLHFISIKNTIGQQNP